MLSLKKMIELYVQYGVERETWDMLYSMYRHCLISEDNWMKFVDKCEDWECNGNIITNCEGVVVYRTDDNGCWQKVK